MNEFDRSGLDGPLLRVFLTVLDERSVTRAAARLGCTQSSISHALQRLNGIVGEPLFLRAGRGIVASQRATELEPNARELLRSLAAFSRRDAFEPARARLELTIAANDLQRDLLLPELYRRLTARLAGFRLRVIPSELPSVDLLRRSGCDLIVTPHPPDVHDVMQRKLFTDSYVCFFDAEVRAATLSRKGYLAARHVTVVYPDGARLQIDRDLEAIGVKREITVAAPSFAGVVPFLRGSDLVATLPGGLATQLMQGLKAVPPPLGDKMRSALTPLVMHLVWHRRDQNDPAHTLVRNELIEIGRRIGSARARQCHTCADPA